eukprot:755494-Hanusia_phi.AAC.7
MSCLSGNRVLIVVVLPGFLLRSGVEHSLLQQGKTTEAVEDGGSDFRAVRRSGFPRSPGILLKLLQLMRFAQIVAAIGAQETERNSGGTEEAEKYLEGLKRGENSRTELKRISRATDSRAQVVERARKMMESKVGELSKSGDLSWAGEVRERVVLRSLSHPWQGCALPAEAGAGLQTISRPAATMERSCPRLA